MKKYIINPMVIISLMSPSFACADLLVADIDGSDLFELGSSWLGNDTNPDLISPSNPTVEEHWLEAVLGIYPSNDLNFIGKQDPSGVGGLTTWDTYNPATYTPLPITGWDYAIVKVGAPRNAQDTDPSTSFSHYAFFDVDSNDMLTLPTGFSFNNGVSHISFFSATTSPVPEPATMLLFGTGLAGLAAARRRKKAC